MDNGHFITIKVFARHTDILKCLGSIAKSRFIVRPQNHAKINNKSHRFIGLAMALVLFTSCKQPIKKGIMDEQKNQTGSSTPPLDTIPKVTGIGGIFFYSENLKETKEWYTKNLGIQMNEWGSSSFESRNVNRPDEVASLQWKPFQKGDDYFSPSKKDFMINYQVQNIEGLVKKLKENGVTLLDEIETYDYGKFVHILDMEGNKIELWEPK